jgi:hypothetical protein
MKKSILEAVHESANDLFDIDLMELKTIHTFDALCLPDSAIGKVKVVEDFLPHPEKLLIKSKPVKITITLSRNSYEKS